ncbi:RraA-like protein [Pseudovirgaria hyperparasitica]|uniref:RraA-like protein n=1 Tax=Pseudovirgaria hyperparasitica TaxID=470096 RepID=A0A6A6W0J5_9PEZI|nr:RraA-like protein [Pseudovirgaria hyperparasitica]KAF2756438.1 RraA-like protein [Pseudovirgaria hyperparasitica]
MLDHKAIVHGLSPYSTCDISDALLKLNQPYGGFLPGIQLFSPTYLDAETRIVGPAYTVKFVPKSDTTSPKLETHYIDTIPASSIIFISSPPNAFNAVYGGLMSTRAVYSRAAGTVIDGCLRDLPAHQALKYPVFARSVVTPAYYEVARPSAVNEPLVFTYPPGVKGVNGPTATCIDAGDWIVGDANGVVYIPKGMVQKVLEMLPIQVEADEKMDVELAKGMSFEEARKKFRG